MPAVRRRRNLKVILREAEKAAILSALRVSRGNMRETADRLGISRSTLYRRVDALRLKTAVRRSR